MQRSAKGVCVQIAAVFLIAPISFGFDPHYFAAQFIPQIVQHHWVRQPVEVQPIMRNEFVWWTSTQHIPPFRNTFQAQPVLIPNEPVQKISYRYGPIAEIEIYKAPLIYTDTYTATYEPRAPVTTAAPAPQSTTQTASGRDYRRFHANDSLIGRPVLCSHQEALCFSFNMLHDSRHGCVEATHRNANFHVSHFVPVDRESNEERCNGYVMAYDDQCYTKDVVRDVICGCDAEPTRHFIHGVECRCTPPTPIHVEQPAEEGHCRIPDLRFPDNDRSRFYRNPFEDIQGFTSGERSLKVSNPLPIFNCSAEQLRCFARKEVWVAGAGAGAGVGACFQLLSRGPCPEEHVVALDANAAQQGYAKSTCVHVRGGCPPGQVRMTFDGTCHDEEDMKLTIRGDVQRTQFGTLVAVNGRFESLSFQLLQIREVGQKESKLCAVKVESKPVFSVLNVGVPALIKNKRYEVENEPTRPDR